MIGSIKALITLQIYALSYFMACQRFALQTMFVEAPDQIFTIQQLVIQPHSLALFMNLF